MGVKLDVQPLLLAPGEGEKTTDRPERQITILCDFPQIIVSRFRYEPGEKGPDPHVHRQHSDAFYVLEGEVEFGLGPEVTPMSGGPGTFAAAPPNVVHTFRNGSDAAVVFLNIHAPNMRFAEMLRAARDGRDEDAGEFDQFEPPADGGRPLSDAAFRGLGEGEPIEIGESSAILKANGPAVGGFFSLMETTLAPGFQGPALNRDSALLDGFYVLEGTLSLQLGREQVEAGRGTFALAPVGKATFANRSAQEVRVLNLIVPA
jgi:uncharacterized cupin superfamily protein